MNVINDIKSLIIYQLSIIYTLVPKKLYQSVFHIVYLYQK